MWVINKYFIITNFLCYYFLHVIFVNLIISIGYNLGNKDKIKYFILSVYDQDGNTMTDMTDYIIHIQFAINKKSSSESLLKSLIDYNKQIYLIVGHIFDLIYKYLNYNI